MVKRTLVALGVASAVACSQPAQNQGTSPVEPPVAAPSAAMEKKYLLERVGEAAVVQLYADGFSQLPLKDKTLVWHLAQAALAGRDIYYDQRYAHNLEMRDVLEAILVATSPPAGGRAAVVEPKTLADIVRYTKLFWINSGPYNNLTARKFLLLLTRHELLAAAQAAAHVPARWPCRQARSARKASEGKRVRPPFS